MNFEFSEEQNLLREQARRFLRDQCPMEAVRAILDDREKSYDEELWNGIVELGWTGVSIPEQYGGVGLGYLELCVLAEELGRSLAPTPYASSVYLATEAILLFGSERQKEHYLPRLATGEIVGTFALAEGPGPPNPDKLTTAVKDDKIRGEKLPVPDGDIADFAIVVARDGADPSLYLVDFATDDVERTVLETIDPTRSQASLRFDNGCADLLGETGRGWDNTQKLFDRAAVLFAFEQSGGTQAVLDMARDYAIERYAFGRPIASYQAIKHKLANMYISATLARSNCYYGAWALSTDADELPAAAATARVSATQAFAECSAENIQTHGGMGFTWEFNCHLYYRRAKALAVNLGSQARWEDRLITALQRAGGVAI
ncbi:MAG: acyl-CoA dehydrogenase family protein [Gammaproteobacteria bacterium]|jgi:alkylation response protein AidB-like acyl-CoA dehydrogenase|nr:acyl-CoA dehydrogenase family protein [Gammaproteobacteria bacterium]HJP36865.1 acyl-CoA dehydrogenase family protein [Gammaproteobacteria bacterium]